MEANLSFNPDDVNNLNRGIDNVTNRLSSGDILMRVGLKIEERAKINASGRPGPRAPTGRLRSSISTQLLSPTEAIVGPSVYYAPFVEFGHRQEVGRFVPIYAMRRIAVGEFKGRYEVRRGLGVRLVNPFAPAYPFMQPALEQVQSSGEMEGVFGQFTQWIEQEWEDRYTGEELV